MPQLGAIGIVSGDLAESARFYRLLGIDVPDPDGDHLDVTLPNGARLMWDAVDLIKQFDTEWQPPQGGPAIALAFECASPQEVDDVHARVVEAGFGSKRDPWDAFWGQRYATVIDPDGNAVDLFAAL